VRYERKQGKIEKKQKVYFMPKSIECAHRKYKKVNTESESENVKMSEIIP